jgi:hypothetical protein
MKFEKKQLALVAIILIVGTISVYGFMDWELFGVDEDPYIKSHLVNEWYEVEPWEEVVCTYKGPTSGMQEKGEEENAHYIANTAFAINARKTIYSGMSDIVTYEVSFYLQHDFLGGNVPFEVYIINKTSNKLVEFAIGEAGPAGAADYIVTEINETEYEGGFEKAILKIKHPEKETFWYEAEIITKTEAFES